MTDGAPPAGADAAFRPEGTRRSRPILLTLTIAGAGLLAFAAAIALRQPRLGRTWDEDVRVLTSVAWTADGAVRLGQVRQWTYDGDTVSSKAYAPVTYDPRDVLGLWLYEQELGLGGRIAHTFLVFEFPERYGADRWLGISVETRREVGETYSLIAGMLRGFELTHIWAREEDLVRRRVEYLDYPLTRYRVVVEPDQVARIFEQFVRETEALAERPRWYHTLRTNCTSSLIEYVNQVRPGAIPWHYSFVLTGRTDDYLADLGYLDTGSGEAITRQRLAEASLR